MTVSKENTLTLKELAATVLFGYLVGDDPQMRLEAAIAIVNGNVDLNADQMMQAGDVLTALMQGAERRHEQAQTSETPAQAMDPVIAR